jgi:hypothetical protein
MYNNKILGEEQFEVLRILQKHYNSSAVIAGGAVRDMLMGKPFRDVDVFYQRGHEQWKSLAKVVEYTLPNVLQFGPEDYVDIQNNKPDNPYKEGGADILQVDSLIYRGVEYQLIEVNLPAIDMMHQQFDVNFNKVLYDGEKLLTTLEFTFDKDHQIFSINPANWTQKNLDRVLETRVPALQIKYPTFKPVVDEQGLEEMKKKEEERKAKAKTKKKKALSFDFIDFVELPEEDQQEIEYERLHNFMRVVAESGTIQEGHRYTMDSFTVRGIGTQPPVYQATAFIRDGGTTLEIIMERR